LCFLWKSVLMVKHRFLSVLACCCLWSLKKYWT